MKKLNLFAIVAIVAIFTACTNESTELLPSESEIKLTSEITPTSRVTSLEYQSTQIVQGQQVGVTIKNAKSGHNNIAWTAGADGSLTNTGETVYYGNGTATITAYHPFNDAWTGTNHTFSVNTDQSSDEGYLASDLLWATATATKTESPVALTFTHKLAKINVTLTSTDITELSDAIISICGTNIATNFNPQTGELSTATTANVQEIKAGVTTANAFTSSAIVVPQTIEAGTKFIKVSHGNKTFYYTLPAEKEFKSGYSYNYTLTVKEAAIELNMTSENIIDWNDEANEGDMEEYTGEEVAETLLLPDGSTFNQIIGGVLADNTNLNKIKFIANSNRTSEAKLVTDADGTVGYIVENGEYLEIHSSAGEFIANSSCVSMFEGFEIISIDFGENFNTENVTDMDSMFYNCWLMTSLNVSSFNTENVTNMAWMFADCQALTSLDVSNFNTENVTDMSCMFYQCFALKPLNVSNFDTQKVTNMNSMFNACEALTSLDVTNFNTENVTDMSYMFDHCQALTSLDLLSFSFKNNVSTTDMLNYIAEDATNKPISIKVTPEAYTYLTVTTNNCNINTNYAKFVKSDGSDW